MYILGRSAMGHASAAALFGENGVAAIEEGKLTRTRSAQGIPRAAIRYYLVAGNFLLTKQ